jgi:uncharacterized protein YndB with AHSA1/START domain
VSLHDDGPTSDSADQGSLERGNGRALLRFTRRLHHPVPTVWRALTEPEHLGAWFPTTIEGERASGAHLHFGFREMEGAPFDGEMVSFDPPTLMELQRGDETLRFALKAEGDGCLLVFTATFDEIGKAARDGAGWHCCLDLLGYEVAGARAPWSAADRWKEVRDVYISRFGTEASTIGPPGEWEEVHGSETGSPG